MEKTGKGDKSYLHHKPTPHSKSAIQAYSSEEQESEELLVYEEEQLAESDGEKAVETSYNERFLNKDDYTSQEIEEYKASLIHNEDSVEQRLKKIYKNRGKLNVVMIAEKPNIAKLISRVLSEDYYSKDIWKGFKSYHFNHLKFKGVPAKFTVCSVYGNMYWYDFDRDTDISNHKPIDILINNPVYLYRTKVFNQKERVSK